MLKRYTKSARGRLILSICLFITLLSLPGYTDTGIIITPGAGVLVDVAPFGIEQYLAMVQCTVTPEAFPYISIKPSFLWNNNVRMVRVPGVIILPVFNPDSIRLTLSLFGGPGIEFYRTDAHDKDSVFVTAGSVISIRHLSLEFFVSRAYREFNTDSDCGIIAGYSF